MKRTLAVILVATLLVLALPLASLGAAEEADQGTYEGAYDANGQRSGYGTWAYCNFLYAGNWENDLPNGEGTLYVNVWQDDALIQFRKKGTWVNGFVDGVLVQTVLVESKAETNQLEVKDGYAIHDGVYPKGMLAGGVPPWATDDWMMNPDAPTPILENKAASAVQFKYVVEDGSAMITGYGLAALPDDLVIPIELDGFPVGGIGEGAFKNGSFASITIADSVTSIGASAFSDCVLLTNITIPESVTSLGEGAFASCRSLTGITIPDSVISLGDYVFQYCRNLSSITLGEGISSIGGGTFSDCSSLTSIDIPNNVTSIGDSAFWGCSSLSRVTIGQSVTSIGTQAFAECVSLASLIIPEGVTSVGTYALQGCDTLANISIPGSLTNIPGAVFYELKGLTTVTIAEGVTSIGKEAFVDCDHLTRVTIPASVKSIGQAAFHIRASRGRVVNPNLTLTVVPGSAAEQYAKKNKIAYVYAE